jgi:anthranilate phosphoribosyltransferase
VSEYNENHFKDLFNNKLSTKEASDMLINMYNRGESDNEIAIGAKIMREYALKLPINKELQNKIVDNCGTGGDKSNSFNISTTVSLLCSAVGSFVAKHGNKGITSKSGSADMLEALGININLTPDKQVKMLEDIRFAFIYAKNHHSVMKHIMPIRQSIPHRSIFNILGPLTNPAGATKQLIGVFDKNFIIKIANALKIINSKEIMVVSSKDGMDEISISDITYFAHLKNNKIKEGIIDPQELGFKLYDKSEIIGAEPKENAKITYDILNGNINGAKKDIVLLNAGYLLIVDSIARDFQDAQDMLNECIDSKIAKKHLEQIIKISNTI